MCVRTTWSQAANYLNTEFAGLPLLDVREAVLARLQQERTLYDAAAGARAAAGALDARGAAAAAGVPRRRRGVAARATAPHESVSLATLRALLEMMEEKERMVHLLNEYIDGPGPDGRHRRRARVARPAAIQPGRLHRGRRRHDADGGRDRPDADALLARDRAGRRHHPGGVARAPRCSLNCNSDD